MKANRKNLAILAPLIVAVAASSWDALAGSKDRSDTTSRSSEELSGEELWSNNCQRCHNLRPPTMYTPAQWDVIVHHMRVRANITGAEQRAIADFLKSAAH
jgi:nitrate/TMAO reductase-like tetraheme cytochrome c subunit